MSFGSTLVQSLGEGDLDMVIGPLVADDESALDITPLFTERYVALVPAHLIKTSADPSKRKTAKLSMAQWIASSLAVVEQEATRHRLIPATLVAMGWEKQIRYRVPYFSAAAALVASCDAVAVMPSHMAQRFASQSIASQKLAISDLPFPLDSYTVSMGRHPRFARDAGLNWLAGLVSVQLAKGSSRTV
jgi:DNA-binding transcriptional LysR family regulator